MPPLLKFLSDENVSHQVVEFLRQAGFDVLDVREMGWCGRRDASILRRARAEKRIVISHDRDFGTLAIARGAGCHGILYLRLKDQRADSVIRTLALVLRRGVLRPRAIVVVSESGIRIRDL